MTQLLHFTEENENAFTRMNLNLKGKGGNSREIEQMKRIMLRAINGGLTEMQKYCMTEHCIKGRKQIDIAEELGLNRATVSRHISAGKKKLKKIAQFYG